MIDFTRPQPELWSAAASLISCRFRDELGKGQRKDASACQKRQLTKPLPNSKARAFGLAKMCAGAPYSNDFIEVYNRGPVSVSLVGLSVQDGPVTGVTGAVVD